MASLKELLLLLEERLVHHDNNRKKIQETLAKLCSRIRNEADSKEEEISRKIHEDFDPREEEIINLIQKLNNKEGDLDSLVSKALEELSVDLNYDIKYYDFTDDFVSSCKLGVSTNKIEKELNFNGVDLVESVANALQEHLDKVSNSVAEARDKLAEVCNERRGGAKKLEKKVNERLEQLFTQEDARIQEVVKLVREKVDGGSPEEVEEMAKVAKAALIMTQKYSLEKTPGKKLHEKYDLVVANELSLGVTGFSERKPEHFTASLTARGEISLFFDFFSDEELALLIQFELSLSVVVRTWEKDCVGSTLEEHTINYIPGDNKVICPSGVLSSNTTYYLKMRIVHNDQSTEWSDAAEFVTPDFKKGCIWKACPSGVVRERRYYVDVDNPRIAAKLETKLYSFVMGSISLPVNKVVSWNIRVLCSNNSNGCGFCFGVAPSDTNQNYDGKQYETGWYLESHQTTLRSGPPHNYYNKAYGPFLAAKKPVIAGDSVGFLMNTATGDLSFVLGGVNFGVAYSGIPLDKPLVPCALLWYEDDSVELDPCDMRDVEVDSSVPVPSNITAKSSSWDSVTLSWDYVASSWDALWNAPFYQIEVDGSRLMKRTSANAFTETGLHPDTEHRFRVRVIRGYKVGKWSAVVKGRTQKVPFDTCWWRKCPEYVDLGRKYSVDTNNPGIATKINGDDWCTIIGNTHLPLDAVTSWSVKVLRSMDNNGFYIFVGVAPSDINQSAGDNYEKCGWYWSCFSSTLVSGPPHYYSGKDFERWKNDGEYVRTGDSVGVVMDTTKGELSFAVNGVDLGVAYKGIPLDKPLVPCVLLKNEEDSVELVTTWEEGNTGDDKNVKGCIIS